jgi:hypothetical protein
MRGYLIMAMFAASLSSATWNGLNLERELTVGTLAADTVDIDEYFAKNSWRLDESLVAGPTKVVDAPCASRHIESDHPVPDII